MAYGARLESVLGASPRGFESPILREKIGRPCEAGAPDFFMTAEYSYPDGGAPLRSPKSCVAIFRRHSGESNPPFSANVTSRDICLT